MNKESSIYQDISPGLFLSPLPVSAKRSQTKHLARHRNQIRWSLEKQTLILFRFYKLDVDNGRVWEQHFVFLSAKRCENKN